MPTTQTNPAEGRSSTFLRRDCLSAIENVAQSIGTMGPVATIGTILPLLIYKTGNGTWLLFLAVLAVFCLISSNINVFASRFTSAGSLAAFVQQGLGNWAGRLTGWSYVVAMIFIATSSAVSSVYYLAIVVTHFTGMPVRSAGLVLLMILVGLLVWWPAHRDIKFSTMTMLAAESFSMFIILVILSAAMLRTRHWLDLSQLRLEGTGFSKYQLGFVLAFMTLAGFESTTALGEEAKAATRTLPRVMMMCILPIGLFFAVSIYCMTALSHNLNLALAQTDAPLDIIALSVGLPTLGWLSSLGVAVSCFGCALGGFNAGSRVVYSMSRSGQIWRYFDAIHPVNRTPYRALALFAGITVLVPGIMIAAGTTMANAIDYLVQITSFGFLGGYLLVCVAAPVFLASRGKLPARRLAEAALTITMLGAVLLMSVVPVPLGPGRYLPYIFAALLITGMLVSGPKKRPELTRKGTAETIANPARYVGNAPQ